jgi:sugar O-acyltransferase (sialic acid O-acetyltransferase NeuD family)
MTPLVIVGTGGHGREVMDIVEAVNARRPTFDLLGFVDDRLDNDALVQARGSRIIGPIDALRSSRAAYVIGIGSGEVRKRIDEQLTRWGLEAATLVHPHATLGSLVVLGAGVVVASGAQLTTNITLGRHAHVNVRASVSHDCRLADYVTVSPGATVSGTVTIEEGALLGAGCTVLQGRTIGSWSTVGAGAVVVDDVAPGVVAVGVPARER